MIPLLLVSNNKNAIDDYIGIFKKNSLFFEVTPSTKEYSIQDIKSIAKETKVFYPEIRNYFLPNFHLSSIPAQNSFLKLLEEPPSNIQFILSTDNKNRLLPTIISRVKIIKIKNNETVNANKFVMDVTKIPLSQFKITDKESANDILYQMIYYFRSKLKIDKNSPVVIKEILRLMRLLESNNLNPQLTVDQELIFIWKQYKIN